MGDLTKSIFEIQYDYIEMMGAIEENEGVLTEDLENKLVIAEDELTVKSQNYGFFIERLGVEKTLVADKIKELQQLKKHIDTLEKKHKQSILDAMATFGMEEIKTEQFTFKTRKSETVLIDCEAQELPPELRIVEIKPVSKTDIKKWLKNGNEHE